MKRIEHWVARRAGLLLTGLAVALYLGTVSPYPVPGESASALAAHADLTCMRPLTQPVWGAAVRLLAAVPFAPLALVLNLFSTLCVAAGIGLFYYALLRFPIHAEFRRNLPYFHIVVGVAGALYLLTSMPVWMSGTRATSESLDLLLLTGSVYFLIRYSEHQCLRHLGVFAFLYGLGSLDSPALLAVAPLVGGAILIVLWFRSGTQWRPIGLLLLGGAGAVVCSGLAAWLITLSPSGEYRGFASIWQAWRAMAAGTWGQTVHTGGWTGWLILGLGYVLLFAWSAASMMISPLGKKRAGYYFVQMAFSLAAPVLLLNIPAAPWVFPQTKGFPLLPVMMLATGFGLAAGFWLFLIQRWLGSRQPLNLRLPAETIVIGAALLCTLPAAGLTYLRVRPQNAELFHWVVVNMLDSLAPRPWLVTDGSSLDPLLLIAARDRGQPLTLINTNLIQKQEYRRYLADHAPDMSLGMLANHSPRGMLCAWLQRGTPTTRELASAENGQLWAQTKQTAVPDRGIYRGAPPRQTDLPRLFEQQVVFWKGTVARLERLAGRGTAGARQERSWLAHRLSRDATAHGCLLDQNGMHAEAEVAYVMARRLYPENVVAFLNLYSLRKPVATPAEDEKARKDLRRLLLPTREPEGVSDLTLKWGPFREPRVYDLYLAAFGIAAAKPAAGKVDPQLVRVIEVRRAGRLDEAIALCRELVKTHGSPESWCLLGCLAYEKGDMPTLIGCLDHTNWQREKTMAGAQLHLLAGLRALMIKNLPLARHHFEEVLKGRPEDPLALEYLVGIYWPTGVTEELWGHLDRLLTLDPGSFAGNAVMGYVFAHEGQYDLAERAFRTALRRRPDAGLLNNLAWVLHLEGKKEEALKYAKESVTLDPNSGQAWDTYGCILQDAQQTAAAGEAFAKAAAVKPDDVNTQLDYVELLCAGKHWDDAAARLARLRSRNPDLSATQRETLLALEARVKAGIVATAKDTRR